MDDLDFERSFLKEFIIPTYILVSESETIEVPDVPKFPVLVFVNSSSGGQLGGDLLVTYRCLLNKDQVSLKVKCYLMFVPLCDSNSVAAIKFLLRIIFRFWMLEKRRQIKLYGESILI